MDRKPKLCAPSAGWRMLDPSDPVSRQAATINRQHVELARMCAGAIDVEKDTVMDVSSRLSARTGLSESRVLAYCDIGFMLRDYPLLADCIGQGGFSLQHLTTIANDLAAVSEECRERVEKGVVQELTPRRANQAVPGVRTVHRTMQRVVEQHDRKGRPTDEEEVKKRRPKAPKPELKIDDRPSDRTEYHLELPKLEALEFTRALENVAVKEECSHVEALLKIVRGEARPDITLNLYAPKDNPTRLHGAGVDLEPEAAREWLERVTHIRHVGYAETEGYVPTAAIRAAVVGRDGTCRFPGCTIEAEDCQLDHIARYNHEDPSKGGPTNTANLHCLCSKHHRLKTSGQWNVAMYPDGSQLWSSYGDGHTLVTEPNGVLRRETFEKRAERRVRRVRDLNGELFGDGMFGDEVSGDALSEDEMFADGPMGDALSEDGPHEGEPSGAAVNNGKRPGVGFGDEQLAAG
ncbi:HNH endonuclease [Corynebacterium heidelbergense]|uniref:HNH endonuclease n=2 Tax=Corynebacterium heidelbergense TaxID=2055947 RepID=A0A364V4Z8_9CORY|nr:HNH endonuclease [Corynebacterium heidelbergense]